MPRMSAVRAMFAIVVIALSLFAGRVAGAMLSGVGGDSRASRATTQRAASQQAAAASRARAPAPTSSSASRPASVLGKDRAAAGAQAQLRMLLTLLLVCVLEAIAVALTLSSARRRGARLAATFMLVILGIATVQPQIEAAYFGVISLRAELRLLMMGAVVAAIVAPVAVFTLGLWPKRDEPLGAAATIPFNTRLWIQRASLCAVVYLALYLTFGYWIAWRDPIVREYYGGAAPEGFIQHLGWLTTQRADLLVLQLARGVLWTGIGLLVLGSQRPARAWNAVTLGILFAALMNAQLLLPNAAMPHHVRMVHLLETAPSNFLMGVLVALAFGRRTPSRPSGRGPRDADTDGPCDGSDEAGAAALERIRC